MASVGLRRNNIIYLHSCVNGLSKVKCTSNNSMVYVTEIGVK